MIQPIPSPAERAIDLYCARHIALLREAKRMAAQGATRQAIRACHAAEILERAAYAEERSR